MSLNWMWFSIASIILTCHSTTALRCFTCDSSTDQGCKYLQTEDTSTTVECAERVNQCFTFLSDDGQVVTRRGCLEETLANCDSPGNSCEQCTQELCNSAQLSFDHCASCDDVDCRTTSTSTEIVSCGQATANKAGCYRYSDSWDGVVKRGCVAELNEETFSMCSRNEEKCKICTGSSCNLKGEQVDGKKNSLFGK